MKLYLKTKDYSVTGEKFDLRYDQSLDMLVTKPQPVNLDPYYKSNDYISHTDANTSLIDRVYQTVKKYSLAKKVRLINNYSMNSKTLLDVGAGTGDFLLAAEKKGQWDVTGIEPNHKARTRAQEKGIDLYSSLGALPVRNYDVITLWHVLEHLADLDNQINKLLELLNPKGTLVIAVPNFKSHDAKHYKEYWAAYDVPRHLWHFSKTAIEKLFSPYGLKVIKVKPLIFDAFYVSMLSEKYKTGRQNYARAFMLGLLSNVKAWGSKEYSSHIYILKRK
ncbi:MAG: class I SAM-dependent methyltransferase [Maribacter sp.]|nr:class I SAM-dependent methyltransferase [Maribacter sp.]